MAVSALLSPSLINQCAEVRHSPAPDQLVGLPPTPPNLVVCDDTGRPMSLSLEPGVVTVITYLWSIAEAGTSATPASLPARGSVTPTLNTNWCLAGPHCGWRQGTGALKSIPYTTTVVVNNQDMYTRQAPEVRRMWWGLCGQLPSMHGAAEDTTHAGLCGGALREALARRAHGLQREVTRGEAAAWSRCYCAF